LDVCAKAGDPALVQRMMGCMQAAGLPPDEVAHTILVMAHEKAGRWRDALAAYAAMRRAGLPRSSFTYRALVGALAGAGRLRSAAAMLDVMAADGVEGNAVVYQILINAFLERGERGQVGRGCAAR
jgi:pentatricopeptide repeat protein